MSDTIRNAVAAFAAAEALESAVSDLQSHGFDRADISFQVRKGFSGHLARDYDEAREVADDPHAPRAAVVDETDLRQLRTLGTSLAATLAAFAAAGFAVFTGGAGSLAIGAAAIAAGGVGAAGSLLGRAAGKGQETFLREQLERGGILLWVRTPDGAAELRAVEILRRHAADDVHVLDVPA